MTATVRRYRKIGKLLAARCEKATAYWPDFGASEADIESPSPDHVQEDASASIRRQAPCRPAAQTPDFTAFLDDVRGRARLASVVGRIPYLRAIASELFLGDIGFEVEEDPEIPGRQCVTVSVELKADLDEVAKRRREWYNHISALLGQDCELVQLIVTVND